MNMSTLQIFGHFKLLWVPFLHQVSKVTIARAFYVTQVDLTGPFQAYLLHNKRATIKIWLVVFCCCTSSATSIKVMDDFSTPAFIKHLSDFQVMLDFLKSCYVYHSVLVFCVDNTKILF